MAFGTEKGHKLDQNGPKWTKKGCPAPTPLRTKFLAKGELRTKSEKWYLTFNIIFSIKNMFYRNPKHTSIIQC